MQVFVLWMISEYIPEHFDMKLVGIYSSQALANDAKQRAATEPGFCGPADRFEIAKFTIDKDIWPLGPFPVPGMNREKIIDDALDEAIRLGDFGTLPSTEYWRSIAEQIQSLKDAGDDFQTAWPRYTGLGRSIVDQPLEPPAIIKLMGAMEAWNRAKRSGRE
ncbi:MAG TPA: hypothetical protein VGJ16_01805 [Pirellulales bacterium]